MSTIKPGVTVVKDDLAKVMKSLTALAKQDVLIGIPQESGSAGLWDQMEKELSSKPAINNATLGYIHEFGSPARNIPERPFLIPGVRESEEQVTPFLKSAVKSALNNKPGDVLKKLHAAGMTAQNAVKAKINSGIGPALKGSTLKARQRRGRTGDVPLIDTGQLRNSITYVVRDKDANT